MWKLGMFWVIDGFEGLWLFNPELITIERLWLITYIYVTPNVAGLGVTQNWSHSLSFSLTNAKLDLHSVLKAYYETEGNELYSNKETYSY